MLTADKIVVDAEFHALIPPLTEDERRTLEENIERDGCLHPVVVWAETGILLDGHNRREICQSKGLSYGVRELCFDSRDDAKFWVIQHQFGRRNLTPFQRAELVLVIEPLVAARAKENQKLSKGHGKKGSQNSVNLKIDTQKELARMAGVSHDTIAKSKLIKEKATPEVQQACRTGDATVNQVYTQIKREEKEKKRESRRTENAEKVSQASNPFESGAKFATIVLDPPWDWGDEGDVDQMGRAKPQYATMSFDALKELDVAGLADDDCHIYLWITNRSLPKGFALLEAWGFRYVTMLTWPKPSFGMGNYFRGQTEHVLFGVKGSQALSRKDASTLLPSWNRGPAGHSSKPPEFHEFVESCSPGPFVELFSRVNRDGWTTWGENGVAE